MTTTPTLRDALENGLSVAVCHKPECSKAYSDLISQQAAEEQSYRERVEELYGPQNW